MTVICAACKETINPSELALAKGVKLWHKRCYPNKDFWNKLAKVEKILAKEEAEKKSVIQQVTEKIKFTWMAAKVLWKIKFGSK